MERRGHVRTSVSKEAPARVRYERRCRCPVVRFEERAKEWGPMARLALQGEPERKRQARKGGLSAPRGGVGSRGVMGPRPGTR